MDTETSAGWVGRGEFSLVLAIQHFCLGEDESTIVHSLLSGIVQSCLATGVPNLRVNCWGVGTWLRFRVRVEGGTHLRGGAGLELHLGFRTLWPSAMAYG